MAKQWRACASDGPGEQPERDLWRYDQDEAIEDGERFLSEEMPYADVWLECREVGEPVRVELVSAAGKEEEKTPDVGGTL